MKTFDEVLKEARKSKGLSQQELAGKLKVARPVISGWEQPGGMIPPPDRAALAATVLDRDPKEFVLLSLQREATSTKSDSNSALEGAVNEMLSQLQPPKVPNSCGPATHLSLCDFPDGFQAPFTVVVGDKRENPPKNVGDLCAFSASTVDDRWIHRLGLPRTTEKISDKGFVMAPHDWLKKRLGKSTIIAISSPASNLYSRIYNKEFIFRFAASSEIEAEWEILRKQMYELNKADSAPADLERFNREHNSRFKWLMREFKRPGFIDVNFERLHVGFVGAENKDFAVISIGANPFSDPEDPRFAILVAGAQYPGTALALKMLAEPSFFVEHPFGGILEADVPRKEVSSKNISWWDKIENSSLNWHTTGQTDLPYSPESIRGRLMEWSEQISKVSLIQQLTKEEITKHLNLISALARAKNV